MKALFILLLIPVLSIGQTVPVKDKKIVYEGKEKMAGVSASEIFNRIQAVLPTIVNKYQLEEQSGSSIKARGELKLKTSYDLVRTASYSIKVDATKNGYEYLIDSVSFTEHERGEKAITKSSKEVFADMEETGKTAEDTERILNEADMRFQKLLDLLKSKTNAYLKKEHGSDQKDLH